MGDILLGKPVAEKIETTVRDEVEKLKKIGIIPKLCLVKVGGNPEAEAYAKSIEKLFIKIGIDVERKVYDDSISFDSFKEEINKIGRNKDIHGILVLRPLSEDLEKKKAFQVIPPDKDVEGITYENLGKLMVGEDCFYPCTPMAVMELLDYYNIPLEKSNVVVIGRSISVGRPLALLLLHRNATVTICHSKTINLSEYTKRADVLIVAVGRAGLITCDMIKEDCVIVDVGTNVLNGKLVGDVDFENVKDKVRAITPVPGGVGIITPRILALNLLKAVKKDENRI